MTAAELKELTKASQDIIAENVQAQREAEKVQASAFLSRKFPDWRETIRTAALNGKRSGLFVAVWSAEIPGSDSTQKKEAPATTEGL